MCVCGVDVMCIWCVCGVYVVCMWCGCSVGVVYLFSFAPILLTVPILLFYHPIIPILLFYHRQLTAYHLH